MPPVPPQTLSPKALPQFDNSVANADVGQGSLGQAVGGLATRLAHTEDTPMPLANPVPLPPHTPRTHYEAQVLFVRTTRCQHCGTIHTISELFACDPLATGGGRHLFPAKVYNPALPLEKIALDVRTTPICHSCTDSLQPTTDRESYARWQDTVRRKANEQRAAAAVERAKRKTEPTLEDLL